MDNNRREFFKSVGAATAVAVLAGQRTVEAATATTPAYAPAYRHTMDLDGFAYEISSFEGGNLRAEIATNYLGPNLVPKKSVSGIVVEEITVTVGLGQPTALYQWIRDMLAGTYTTKNGDIISADVLGRDRRLLTFFNATLTGVAFPAFDLKDHSPAEMTLSFQPANARSTVGNLAISRLTPPKSTWLHSNFRLTISGLENSCAHVNRIEPLAATLDIPPLGGQIERIIPNLTFYCPEEFADDFVNWHYDWMVNGNHLEQNEKTGQLDFLAPDKRTVLFTLSFSGIGNIACGLVDEDAKTGATRVMKVEIYLETMAFVMQA